MIPNWDSSTSMRPVLMRSGRPWATWIALAALWILTFTEQYWVFPLLFLGWAAYDIVTGESSFVQRVTRRSNPATYWLVVVSWIALSVLWLLYPS